MASSTLDPDNMPEMDRQPGKGHGTRALGPSDISDNGSDVQDGMRWTNEADIGLHKGTHDDPDSAADDRSAGPDLGDAWLDSDTDSSGTGEAATAGRDPAIQNGADVRTDRVDYVDPADEMIDARTREQASAEDADEGIPSIPEADKDRAQRQQSRH